MNNFGFIKVASTTPTLEVANCKYNINEILKIAEQAEKEHVSRAFNHGLHVSRSI